MSQLWWRYPADQLHHRPGADLENPDASWRTAGSTTCVTSPGGRRSNGVIWCSSIVLESSSKHHRVICPRLIFITADSRCPHFATLDHAFALKASRKRFAPVAEFSARSRPFLTFYAVYETGESATCPQEGRRSQLFGRANGRDACESAVGRPILHVRVC